MERIYLPIVHTGSEGITERGGALGRWSRAFTCTAVCDLWASLQRRRTGFFTRTESSPGLRGNPWSLSHFLPLKILGARKGGS